MTFDKRRVLFVGGIPASMTADVIRDHFIQYGPVVSVRIMKDRLTKTPKGYAYVTVADHRAVPLILSQPHLIAGRAVDVQVASRRGEKREWKEDQKKRKLFVSNIPSHVDNQDLGIFFSRFGEVRNAYVIRDFVSKASLNYGYVEFFDSEAMQQVFLAGNILLDGAELICLPFQGRVQETKHLAPPYYRTRPYYDEYCPEPLSETYHGQQNPWDYQEKMGTKTTKNNTLQSLASLCPGSGQHRYRKKKYEFIGVSCHLNQDESNYKFRIKLENKSDSLEGYFRAFMSLYGTSSGINSGVPQLRFRTTPISGHSKPSLQPGFYRSETMATNTPQVEHF
jgi:RNA recognition motif-containing protein